MKEAAAAAVIERELKNTKVMLSSEIRSVEAVLPEAIVSTTDEGRGGTCS